MVCPLIALYAAATALRASSDQPLLETRRSDGASEPLTATGMRSRRMATLSSARKTSTPSTLWLKRATMAPEPMSCTELMRAAASVVSVSLSAGAAPRSVPHATLTGVEFSGSFSDAESHANDGTLAISLMWTTAP